MPQFSSDYFDNIDEAMAVAQRLVDEDNDFSSDRQVVANFYNGRDTMTNDQAEKENIGNVVNHLFGYNAIDKLRAQINSLFTSGDTVWKIECKHPELNVSQNQMFGAACTQALARRLRRSRRLRPEWRAVAGNLVLHGRNPMLFADQFDWCPKSSHLYVSRDTRPNRESITYAFSAEDLSADKLNSYLKMAESSSSGGWNLKALQDAVNALKPGSPSNPLVDKPIGGEKTAEHENNSSQPHMDGDYNTRSTLPVWYLYEVDHTKADKPVSLKILARYSLLAPPRPKSGIHAPDQVRDALLFENENHFKSVCHWCIPFFIDTEIGGRPLWNSAVGIGKLNYPRDADVEEFFNLAMDGAKDAMRTKWAVADGANREKIARYFADRQDLLPEGLNPVKVEVSGNYQHAFNVIQILRQLSAEDAGTGTANMGGETDELEVQARERQSGAQNLIAARMADIYDSLDDMGTEILRRFMTSTVSEDCPGYCDIMLFREELKGLGVTEELRKKLAENDYGEFKWLEVKTSRALGDGSRMAEMQTAQMLMGSMGAFGPQAQELIKRKFAFTLTRDVDWVNELVPIQDLPNPDQLARARNENTAALSRGIIGFVPQVNPDDVNELHIPEHDQELDAVLKRSEDAGGMDDSAFAGFKALATHQAQHVTNLKQGEQNAETANAWLQKLERQTTSAQGLQAAFQSQRQDKELTAAEKIKFQQKDRDQVLRERAQASVESDRQVRNELESRQVGAQEAKIISDAAVKAAGITTAPMPQLSPEA